MHPEYLFADPPRAGRAAENIDFTVMVEGAPVYAQIMLAAGEGDHPTALMLHGFPGREKHLDIVHALRRMGMNAVFFSYRGAWGSGGDYAVSHLTADAQAVLQHLRENAARYRANGDYWLVGHSMGGFTALHTLASGAPVRGAVLITPCDLGMMYLEQPAAFCELIDPEDGGDGCLHTGSPGALRADAQAHAREWAFSSIAPRLPKLPMLFIGGTQDVVTPIQTHIAPLVAHLGAQCTYREIDDGHSFCGSRQTLIQTLGQWLASHYA